MVMHASIHDVHNTNVDTAHSFANQDTNIIIDKICMAFGLT